MTQEKQRLIIILLVSTLIVETICFVGMMRRNDKAPNLTGVYVSENQKYHFTIYGDKTAKLYYKNGDIIQEDELKDMDGYLRFGEDSVFYSIKEDAVFAEVEGGYHRFNLMDKEAYILTIHDGETETTE